MEYLIIVIPVMNFIDYLFIVQVVTKYSTVSVLTSAVTQLVEFLFNRIIVFLAQIYVFLLQVIIVSKLITTFNIILIGFAFLIVIFSVMTPR